MGALKSSLIGLGSLLLMTSTALGQVHGPAPPPPTVDKPSPAAEQGKTFFKSNCGFCHGDDGTGARAPDLIRSSIVVHDENGNQLGPFVRAGRPDQGMPSFSNLDATQLADIVAFLHYRVLAAGHTRRLGADYPIAKILTGNAVEGKAFFNEPGNCRSCHSVTGDLAGVAGRYRPVDLQQQMVYPSEKKRLPTAVVTLADGTRYEGTVQMEDAFDIGLTCSDGWYRSWPKDRVKIELKDPLEAHRKLMTEYTDADIHNLLAYLETLR